MSGRDVFTSKFTLLQKVRIDGDLAGVITAFCFRETNSHPQVEVQWFANGTPQTAWFHEERLS